MDFVIKLCLLKESIYRGSCFMTHAVWGQSPVLLWEWKCYKPARRLLMISINLDFPADSHLHKCNSHNPFNRNILHVKNSVIAFNTPAVDSCGCVQFSLCAA